MVNSEKKNLCEIRQICLQQLYDLEHPSGVERSAYRGTSLIRNTHPPRITIGP